jgi:hypothetical protein
MSMLISSPEGLVAESHRATIHNMVSFPQVMTLEHVLKVIHAFLEVINRVAGCIIGLNRSH